MRGTLFGSKEYGERGRSTSAPPPVPPDLAIPVSIASRADLRSDDKLVYALRHMSPMEISERTAIKLDLVELSLHRLRGLGITATSEAVPVYDVDYGPLNQALKALGHKPYFMMGTMTRARIDDAIEWCGPDLVIRCIMDVAKLRVGDPDRNVGVAISRARSLSGKAGYASSNRKQMNGGNW